MKTITARVHALFIHFISLLFFSTSSFAEVAPLVLGVHPYLQEDELIKRFTPLANHLGEKLGRSVRIKIASDYSKHIESVGRDQVDIAFMGPSSYVEMVAKYGRKPLLARLEVNDKPFFKGAIIARQESQIQTIEALKGKRFAFGDPLSTMSYIMPMAALRARQVGLEDLAEHKNYRGHNNVALAVLMGEMDAGAVKEEIYDKYREQGLKLIAYTAEVSEHLFLARLGLPPTDLKDIRRVLLGIKKPEQVKAILAPIKQTITGLVEVKDADYDTLRQAMNHNPFRQ